MNRFAWLLCITAVAKAAQQDPRELFERARMLADQNRNLPEAVRLYGQVIAIGTAHRALAAQAQYRQGLLYERLGRKIEAERAFRSVVLDFGDQTEVVRLARAKLPARSTSQGMRTRQVWAGIDVDTFGSPSPDGRWLSFTDWASGNLALRNLATGETRQVTNERQPRQPGWALPLWSIFSADGTQLAYTGSLEAGFEEVRVIGVDGTKPRVLYRLPPRHSVRLASWSPDGKHLVGEYHSRSDVAPELLLISVADGATRTLASARCPCWRIQFSSDSRFIAYDTRTPGEERSDVSLVSLDGKSVEPIIRSPESEDSLIGWTTDGRHLLFSSDRSGTTGIWSVAVSGGKAVAAPELIRRDTQIGNPLGITKDGSLYYATTSGSDQSEVYVAEVDLNSGKVVAAPRTVSSRYVGNKRMPIWSPDGKQLAYLTLGGTRLVVVSLETGEEREIAVRMLNVFFVLWWRPDGRSVIVQGMPLSGPPGTFAVDLDTGAATFLANPNDRPAFSPDARTIYYGTASVDIDGLYAQELETGKATMLYKAPERIRTKNPSTAVSPDGRWLAIRLENVPPGSNSLAVLSVTGGEPRIVTSDPGIFGGMSLNWTPDSQQIIYARASAGRCSLWVVPASGGSPRRIELDIAGDRTVVRLSPDGKRLAFNVRKKEEEVWVMENFLNR